MSFQINDMYIGLLATLAKIVSSTGGLANVLCVVFLSVCQLKYHVCSVVAVIACGSQNGAAADAVRELWTQMLE